MPLVKPLMAIPPREVPPLRVVLREASPEVPLDRAEVDALVLLEAPRDEDALEEPSDKSSVRLTEALELGEM